MVVPLSPDEQAERDRIAMTLDILLCITAINLHRDQPAPPERPAHERVAWVDQGWLEFWRRNAVA